MGPDTDPASSKTHSPQEPQSSDQALNLPQVTARVELGQVVMTPGVRDNIPAPELMAALNRHTRGDWGTVSRDDWKENDLSLREGFRILSAYETKAGKRFWIITEADRSSTCLLLPEEY